MELQAPIMVLVTLQRMCARLIREGADLAMKQGCSLKVVHVATPGQDAQGAGGLDAQVLNFLYALANEAGAEMCMLSAEVPVTAMADYAEEQGIKQILMGGGEHAKGIAETLSQLVPGVQVMILEEEEA